MKTLKNIILLMILIGISCTIVPEFTAEDKQQVETEVLQFVDSLTAAFDAVSPEKTLSYFMQTDELAIASQGYLITDYYAVLDTAKAHLKEQQKQVNKTVQNKIYVINKEAAVISTSKRATITFKSGKEINTTYALTILLIKRDGKWKIAHYHN